MPVLTRRESQFRDAIADHVRRTGGPPSRAELRAAMGWKSVSTVQYYIDRLRAKGVVTLAGKDKSARNLRLVDEARPADSIPLIGQIAAGVPLLSDENVEATIPAAAARRLFCTPPDYFLRVQGDSMAGAGIHDGDLVAVRKASDAVDGQIVVACLDGEATLKRLRRGNGHVALMPENPDHEPVMITGERFEIRGIVVGTLRDLT